MNADKRMREVEDSYTENELREGFIFSEKIALIRSKREQDKAQLQQLALELDREANDKEELRRMERERKEREEREFEGILEQAQKKREQILNY